MTGRHRAERARPGRRKRRRRAAPVFLAVTCLTAGAVGIGVATLAERSIPPAAVVGNDLATNDNSAPAPDASARNAPTDLVDRSQEPAGDGRRRPLSPDTTESATVTIPEDGTGAFEAAPGSTPAVGDGALVTYTVEVEADLPLPSTEAAQVIDQTLGDPRSWTASSVHALQRVPAAPDIRVLLATPGTTDRLCAPLDTGGRLSCRNDNMVVLNAWRWINGADAYTSNLTGYRRYLINHEFGHALGNAHQYCTQPGDPASVMVQQTKGLQGCQANPWPFP